MQTFKKVILRPGVYNVRTSAGRKMTPVTKEYINKTCNTANEMLGSGMRIPAPFSHKDDGGVYPSPLLAGDEQIDAKTNKKKVWSSDINGGFWTKFETNDNDELVGHVEVSDDVAEKVGTTVRETSVFVMPEWEDGLGRNWENALYHVAMVTNPVEPNQDNFEVLKDSAPELSIAMAFSMSDEVSTDANDKVAEAIGLLSERLNISLPGDTSTDNFFDRLVTVLLNINQEEDEDITTPQKGSSTESSPVIMSQDNKDNLVELQTQAGSLLGQLVESLKTSLKSRVQSMVENGKIGKSYAEKSINPQIDALAMSLDELGEDSLLPKTAIEMSLDVLEQNEALIGEETKEVPKKEMADESKDMNDEEAVLTEEELEKVYDTFI